jgi:ubiquinone/menaquinone biosynthesis C-methylase UbiE
LTVDNRAFWDRSARKYDTFTRHFSQEYAEVVRRISQDVEEAQRIVEVAAGTGLITLELARAGRQIEGIDISPAMIIQAQKKGRVQGLDNVRFLVGSAYELPWPDESCDAVICANALHVMERAGQAVNEMRRVLKVQGKLIVPTYCHGENLRARTISCFMHLFGFRAYTHFTVKGLQGFLEAHGFSTVMADRPGGVIPLCYVVCLRMQ